MKAKYIIGVILFAILVGAGIGLKMFFKPHAEISKLNIDFQVGTKSLKNINAMMDLKYDDMNEWWHPIIKD